MVSNLHFRGAFCAVLSVCAFMPVANSARAATFQVDVEVALTDMSLRGFLSGTVPLSEDVPTALEPYDCWFDDSATSRYVFCLDSFDLLEFEAAGYLNFDGFMFEDQLSASIVLDENALSGSASNRSDQPSCTGSSLICASVNWVSSWSLEGGHLISSGWDGGDSASWLDTRKGTFEYVGLTNVGWQLIGTDLFVTDCGSGCFFAQYAVTNVVVTPPAVPIGSSGAMLGSGLLVGAGFVLRRRGVSRSRTG